MDAEKRKVIFTNCHKQMLDGMLDAVKMLEGKGADYGTDNFIQAAEIASIITGQTILPMDVAACLIGIKMARYGNLVISNTKPVNEAISDTVKDLANYVHLMERERNRFEQEIIKNG